MERAVPVLVQTDLLVAAWSSLALILQPAYLDILPLYIALLLVLPLFLLLERAQRGPALVLSVSIWVLAEATGLNLPSSRSLHGWYFNPFAWQLLFCIGLFGSQTFRHPPQSMRSHWLIAIAIAYVILAFTLTTPCWFRIAAEFCVLNRPHLDMNHLAPWRIARGLALSYLALIAIPNRVPWLVRPARAVVTLGQNSLSVFCAGSLVGLLSAIALTEVGADWRSQLLLNMAGIGLLFSTAWCRGRGLFKLLPHYASGAWQRSRQMTGTSRKLEFAPRTRPL